MDVTTEENTRSADAGQDVLGGLGGLDMVLDVPVNLSMEVGRTRMPIRELLQLGQGSVIELDRLAGAPWTCW